MGSVGNQPDFRVAFRAATARDPHDPYPWQCRLACGPDGDPKKHETLRKGTTCESRLINIPTGLGKTAGVTLAWMWNRIVIPQSSTGREKSDFTPWPRRLVYCLPMRTLVEQTAAEVEKWLKNLLQAFPDNPDLRWLCGIDPTEKNLPSDIDSLPSAQMRSPVILMGGEDLSEKKRDWDIYPEKPCILIGTQDMLLSRALNRGYGMSRYRWPMHFALLNNDCLWVMDEVQLMGPGLATVSQLEAFRNQESMTPDRPCFSWWSSATLDRKWIETVDLAEAAIDALPRLDLSTDDLKDPPIRQLVLAAKPIGAACTQTELAGSVVKAAQSATGPTLVVLNTVARAKDLFARIKKHLARAPGIPTVLVHSQFRAPERVAKMVALTASRDQKAIIVATQVIEAGVDFSAENLFTELAPWPSLVQRFGRCNRKGEFDAARIQIIPVDIENSAAPYDPGQLIEAQERLASLKSASIETLARPEFRVRQGDQTAVRHVLRRKDIVELFDTTPDLAGNDIDIDRFIRDADHCHVRVYWRVWPGSDSLEFPPADLPSPARDELCSAPVGDVQKFAMKKGNAVFAWDFLNESWRRLEGKRAKQHIYPGVVLLLPASLGGYDVETGWNPDARGDASLDISARIGRPETNNGFDRDPSSVATWQTIAQHSDLVASELNLVAGSLARRESVPALQLAARWHDWGKAHTAFVAKLIGEALAQARQTGRIADFAAKAPPDAWRKGKGPESSASGDSRRPHFRHELAAAIAFLQRAILPDLDEESRNLVAYLIAAHHGKVRLSIRSLPGEWHAPDNRRFARGVWDDDVLPPADLGGGIVAPATRLSLEPMELGLCEEEPFTGQPSWAERAIKLRDRLGPFRLAFLETVLRAADARASCLALEATATAIAETPASYASPQSLSPEEEARVAGLVKDGLAIQDRFKPEPLGRPAQ